MQNRMTPQEIIKISTLVRSAANKREQLEDDTVTVGEILEVLQAAEAAGRLDTAAAYMEALQDALSTNWIIYHLARSKTPFSMALDLHATPGKQRGALRLGMDIGL